MATLDDVRRVAPRQRTSNALPDAAGHQLDRPGELRQEPAAVGVAARGGRRGRCPTRRQAAWATAAPQFRVRLVATT